MTILMDFFQFCVLILSVNFFFITLNLFIGIKDGKNIRRLQNNNGMVTVEESLDVVTKMPNFYQP